LDVALKVSAEGRQRSNGLFDRVANDLELCRIESARGVGRALFKRHPDEWASDEAAHKAFNRAKAAASGEYIDGRWKVRAQNPRSGWDNRCPTETISSQVRMGRTWDIPPYISPRPAKRETFTPVRKEGRLVG
jgi:hypothetical protein